MGVEYAAASGYGFVLGPEDDWERIGQILGVDMEDGDYSDFEVVEAICKKYNLNYATAGDSYSGLLYFLIGNTFEVDIYKFKKIRIVSDANQMGILNRMYKAIDELGIEDDLGYYSGLHVY
jgi:hypothetical protein